MNDTFVVVTLSAIVIVLTYVFVKLVDLSIDKKPEEVTPEKTKNLSPEELAELVQEAIERAEEVEREAARLYVQQIAQKIDDGEFELIVNGGIRIKLNGSPGPLNDKVREYLNNTLRLSFQGVSVDVNTVTLWPTIKRHRFTDEPDITPDDTQELNSHPDEADLHG